MTHPNPNPNLPETMPQNPSPCAPNEDSRRFDKLRGISRPSRKQNALKAKITTKQQYRVVWKRKGLDEKRKVYATAFYARRFLTLLGPEPWKAFGKSPFDYVCCSGCECGCGGVSVAQAAEAKRKEIPALEYARIEVRDVTVSPWRNL